MELPSRYDPHETENKWYERWEKEFLFSAKPDPTRKPYCIVIPPPNVTGILHMGHALNNTIQDILIRYQRMQGKSVLWMSGTDHAGIATQNVVEKALAKEGLKRQDLGREKFVERVWSWKEQYGSTIVRQLKKLGASCDWQRLRFTMDEEYSKAVIEVFVRLYEKKLIYRGNYIINWCPRCQTALSDEEAPHRELAGNLYYLKYPFKDTPNSFVVVATTRPETMLGDTAVAVNPKDARYKKIVGKTLMLPLLDREIKVIADSMVDMKFGTGAVKVTPAHDPNDYALGVTHALEFINVLHPDGRMNERAGEYAGMDRFEAREVLLEDLKERGLIEKVVPHALSAGHCYRCHTIIEPYLSRQWFVRMKPLAEPAIEAVKKGKIVFYPKRWKKVYLNWMENIQDWCISRQIWWGHRLPVYYCKNCLRPQASGYRQTNTQPGNAACGMELEAGVIVSRTKPEKCPHCGTTDIYQDEDVLDTWFSSWLWPFATFYWPFTGCKPQATGLKTPESLQPALPAGRQEAWSLEQRELKYFYPTSVLVTAPEIIFFWVARMIMAGLEFMKEVPFRDVYIHGTVRDIEGKKMSKSLGNIIDPLEIIKEYGTDALRFSLISITAQGQDVFLSKERFEQGRNFANKIWNASRFILMNLDAAQISVDLCVFFKKERLKPLNRWILSRFYSTAQQITKALETYEFNEAANLLYTFFWHEFCDWYLEMAKPDIQKKENQVVAYKVLEKFLRLAHPFMPFVTEEIWQRFSLAQAPFKSISVEPWPHIQEQIIDTKLESEMQLVFEVITCVRNMRAELEIPLQDTVEARIVIPAKATKRLLMEFLPHIQHLAKVSTLHFDIHYRHIKGEFVNVLKSMHIAIPLSKVVDTKEYLTRLVQKIDKLKGEIKNKEKMLSNEGFLKGAPADIVSAEKVKLKDFKETLKKMETVKHELT